ncbi:MAG: hypothetical protein PHC89_02690 [Candidatus Pacebacteria bacterium]|nr:hypothetical protein [Candidatus Paceibacterota bacterium]
MTKNINTKKAILKSFIKNFYKSLIVAYSFYLAFSTNALALTAEAPSGTTNFKQIIVDKLVKGDPSQKELDALDQERVEKIRKYFARYNLPLQHEAEHFVEYAHKYEIDWRLLAAIGFVESTGGKFACQSASYSAFGWGSCKINFASYEESIDVVSQNLGGHNPNTARYYAGKDVKGILETYNPPHIVPNYASKVMRQMDIIDAQ